ncbi:hypothetical protein Gotri_024353, partial [Gossypium trilobum]|nr:hypothetical protein [Gossypium trilobum]
MWLHICHGARPFNSSKAPIEERKRFMPKEKQQITTERTLAKCLIKCSLFLLFTKNMKQRM